MKRQLGVWYYGLPGAAIGSVLATFVAYTLFLKRLSKVMSVPIAKLQDWKNLERVGSLRARGTFFGRLAETIDPNRCDSRPAAVLVLYVIILFATGYYRTLAEMRRE